MAFPLLGEIEKLINERGSAAIMKERLSLAADQYSALEKELATFKLRAEKAELAVANLEFENKSLSLDIQKAKENIRDFEEKLVCGHKNTLEEIEVKIMVYISKEKSCLVKDISSSLSIGECVIESHLEELKSKGMLSSQRVPMLGNMWSLEQQGRRGRKGDRFI